MRVATDQDRSFWVTVTDKRKNLRDECCQSRTLLFGVTPTDPAVFGFTLIVIIGVGLPRRLSRRGGSARSIRWPPCVRNEVVIRMLMPSLAADPAKPNVPFRADK